MSEQVCMTGAEYCGGAVGVDAGGYPVETTGNAALDILEHRSSTRAFARDDDDRPVAVTDEQRAAILHAASRAPSAGAMMMYSIVSVREQATLDRLADLCDHQPMIAKAPWALIFVVDYAKWIDLFEHVGCFEPEFVERTGKAPRRAPGLGDFAIAAQDAVIAAQNAVVAAEALGLGSCYIGDIVENAEEVAELLDLPPYTMPLSMLIIGTPRKERPAIAHPVVNLVHEERYCRADAATMDAQVDEMDAMFRPHAREVGERVVDIYTRKHTSPFMAEMSRSMEWWFKNWLGK
ncbi:MAG: nitroreductase family protein [Collinsella sp.]|nr:nitroreductase family protein [Collinsella sp.]